MSANPALPALPTPASRPLGSPAVPGRGGRGSNKSVKEKIISFFAADSFGGLTRGAWTAILGAAAAVAATTLYDRFKKQEEAGFGVGFEKERKLTSSKDDWRRGKSELKEGAKDVRSAASKWAKGE